MGAGKTTVGKILSKKLNLPLLDMDSIISEEEEKTINSIFLESGEKYFRDLENNLTTIKLLPHQQGLIQPYRLRLQLSMVVIQQRQTHSIFIHSYPNSLIQTIYHSVHRRLR
mgnify:CR=1 FL=1